MHDKSKQAEHRAQQLLHRLLRQAATTPELAAVLLRHLREEVARLSAWCETLAKLPRAERRRLQRKLGGTLAGVALALALSNIPAAQAASITVTGGCTLVDAITAANTDTAVGSCAAGSGADTITLPGGTITLTSVNNTTPTGDNGLPLITSTITIAGNGTTIARDGSAPNFRIFQVESSGNLTLNDTTISGGNVLGSGAGGGIRNRGTLTLNTSTLSGNSANHGGGIIITGSGTMTLNGSTVSGNSAYSSGGGIENFGTATLIGSTVSDNISTTDFGGGGIANYGTLTLIGSTVSGNSADDSGGGILNSNTLMLTNSTVSGNSAGGAGGGILSSNTLTLTNSTVSGNSADGSGGGIFNSNTLTLARSLISGNSASSNQEIRNNAGTVNSNNYNLFGHSGLTNAQAFNFTPSGSDITATSNGSDPTTLASILDTTLQNNGGDTLTHALLIGSPALDAAPTGPATDQRGVSRPQRCAADFDIGAFELEQSCPPTPTPTNTPTLTNTPTPVPPDPYADAVASGTSALILNPANAVGAPNGNSATIVSLLSGALVLDMGAGEEGIGNLKVYYSGLSVEVNTVVDFLDQNGSVISTGQLHLLDLSAGTHVATVTYSGAPAPYRFVRLRAVLVAAYQVDAVETTQLVTP